MGGSQKAPPRPYRPPHPPLGGRLIYAHIDALAVACPRCGRVYLSGRLRKPNRLTRKGSGYDLRTGHFRCSSCRYGAYLGVIFWPTIGPGRKAMPLDHVLSPGQAAALRLRVSVEAGILGDAHRPGDRRVRTNLECTCRVPCPVHLEAADAGGEEDP